MTDYKEDLTQSQIHRQDFVDNKIQWLLTELAEDVTNQHAWSIEDIASVREAVLKAICDGRRTNDFRTCEEIATEFYPFLEEEDE